MVWLKCIEKWEVTEKICIQPRFSITQNNNLAKICMAKATLRHTLAMPLTYCAGCICKK